MRHKSSKSLETLEDQDHEVEPRNSSDSRSGEVPTEVIIVGHYHVCSSHLAIFYLNIHLY